ncbi:MAG TPA: sialidase family protein [Candidatus Thermoplasmatota archaeon]|nr:sialidase family protein [Candidatus Thermoplasmatota archaeon]
MRAPPALLAALLLAGCVQPTLAPAALAPAPTELDTGRFVAAHAAGGAPVAVDPRVVPRFIAETLPHAGGEPTLGVTSEGVLFLVADAKVLRSVDGAASWEVVSTPLSAPPATLDPFLYVDPATDRVYSDQLYVGCSWLSWSDDRGDTWTTNPVACGLPANDHQKLVAAAKRANVLTPAFATGRVLYYAYNAIVGGTSRVAMSYDGGRTFPVSSVSWPGGSCSTGLHGDLVADEDGVVYLPKRDCEGFVLLRSMDSGLTWTSTPVGRDAGGTLCRKDADLALDDEGTLYGVWTGGDNHVYLQTSQDRGDTWRERSLDASPPGVAMATMPAVVAGSGGRAAIAWLGTDDASARGPDEVREDARWHLYVTTTLDALSDVPTFVTVQVTDDPVQVGPIDTNSECDAPGGSRNLLDFIDAKLAPDGRVLVSYTDGCVDACVDSLAMEDSRSARVGFAQIASGPSLRAELPAIAAPLAGPSR